MVVIAELVLLILEIYTWIVIASAIMSWLVAFNVVNMRNQFVYSIGNMLYRLTQPALRPIQRIVPTFGGVDVSPIVLLLILWFLQRLIERYVLLPALASGL
jgi:YggT family protein